MSGYAHDVSAIFREVALRYPDRKAVIWSADASVSFAELDRVSDRAARFLRLHGVGRGDRVCIRLDKCPLAYALIIACLKTGAPYVFLDPDNPAARAAQIVATCRPKVVFSAKEAPLPIDGGQVFVVDRENSLGVLDGVPPGAFARGYDVTGADPAYIMFTSGSTGAPKGAVMSHDNVRHFLAWARSEFAVTPDDVFTNVNPLHFDNSVVDVYASLFNGAALVPVDALTLKDPYAIIERINRLGCTVYFSVPSLLIYFQTLKLITPGVFPGLRTIVFGGEGYPKTKLKALYDCVHPRVRLVNVYGPTECTCICSAYAISAADFADLDGYPPLGALIPNFSYAILNERDEPAPPGQTGCLWLAGPGVGLGYFNDAEQTGRAFRQHPLNAWYHERAYRTGDLVRLSPEDGKIHFVGREDSQIKHQGYRIELGEIEHALGRVGGVDEVSVLHSSRDGLSLIVAVVASRDGLTAETVRTEVARHLPPYMIPSRIDVVPELPKNANGKIDRKLLRDRYR